MNYTLEVCADSVESAIAARNGGATRIELCSNLIIGGTTPSLSLLREVKKETGLHVRALLRPRFGDFLYTETEYKLMLEDAEALINNGADGIVSGFLLPDGQLDRKRMGELISLVHGAGKRFTLHRAFDVCRDPFEAIEVCKELGVDTILTSGQAPSCVEGLPILCKLFPETDGIELLMGAGINAAAIEKIRAAIPEAESFHMSGKKVLESKMEYRNERVSMGLSGISEFEVRRTDENEIRKAAEVLSQG